MFTSVNEFLSKNKTLIDIANWKKNLPIYLLSEFNKYYYNFLTIHKETDLSLQHSTELMDKLKKLALSFQEKYEDEIEEKLEGVSPGVKFLKKYKTIKKGYLKKVLGV